jgi:hypothetical protein
MPSQIPDNEVVLAIDPGNIDTAYCTLRGRNIVAFGKVPNALMLQILRNRGLKELNIEFIKDSYDHVACEMICSYGMPAGASLFDTCVFIGEIRAAALREVTLIPRIQVKSHICHSGKATDSNIRQALIDMFGPQGKKSAPGPTFGISADVWSALAIAETFRSGDFTPYILSADKPENACQK